MTETGVSRRPRTTLADSERSSKTGNGQQRSGRKSASECDASGPRTPGRQHKRREKSSSDAVLLSPSGGGDPPMSPSRSPRVISPLPTPKSAPLSPTRRRDDAPASPTRRREKVPSSPTRRRDDAPVCPTPRSDKVPSSPTRRRDSAPVCPALKSDKVPASPTPRRVRVPVCPAPRSDKVPASPTPRREKVPASPRREKVPASSAPRREKVPASPTARRDKVPSNPALKRDIVPASPVPIKVSSSPQKSPRKSPQKSPRKSPQKSPRKSPQKSSQKRDARLSPTPGSDNVPATRTMRSDPPSPALIDNAPASPKREVSALLSSENGGSSSTGKESSPTRKATVSRKHGVPLSSPRKRNFQISGNNNPLPGDGNSSLAELMSMMSKHSSMRSNFDVDAPRDSVRLRRDCASAAASTVDLPQDGLTEEEQAWAGIEAVLDDNESIATHDVLPEAAIEGMPSSVSSTPVASFLVKGKKDDQNQTAEDDDDDDSHDAFMKGLCGLQSYHTDEMPGLSSCSSIQSEVSTANSILSCISQRNMILQEDLENNPMNVFIESMTDALERKQQAGPAPSCFDGNTGIFDMFSWSSKNNVDETIGTTKGQKESYMDRHPEQELLLPQFSSSRDMVAEDPLNNSMPSLSESSLPSLSSVRESEVGGSTLVGLRSLSDNNSLPSLYSVRECDVSVCTNLSDKWGSYGDLNVDYGRVASPKATKALKATRDKWASHSDLNVDYGQAASAKATRDKWASFGDLNVNYGEVASATAIDRKVRFGELTIPEGAQIAMPQTAKRRLKKKKKMPPPALKKKKLIKPTKPIEEIKEIKHPEALLDYYKTPARQSEMTAPETPVRCLNMVKLAAAPMRNFMTPLASNRSPKIHRYKDTKSPRTMLKIFRRNSPTSVTAGRQESQFYPSDDDEGEEELGSLLSC